jgi:hypothetical protein
LGVTDSPTAGWLNQLSDEEREVLYAAFTEMVRVRKVMSDEEDIAQLEMAMHDSSDPESALLAWRVLLAGQMRQQARQEQIVENITRIVDMLTKHRE